MESKYFYDKYSFVVSQKDYYQDIKKIIEINSKNVYTGVKHNKQFMRNLVMYIINLMMKKDISIDRRYSTIAKKNSKWHTPRYAIKAIDYLVDNGLATLQKGHSSKHFDTGFCSSLHSTNKFNTLFKSIKVKPLEVDVNELYLQSINEDNKRVFFSKNKDRYIRYLRRHKNMGYSKGIYAIGNGSKEEMAGESLERIDFINTELLKKIHLRLNNKDLDEEYINMARNIYLTRMYTNYGEGGGRFMQMGCMSYQQLKKDIRRDNLLINNKKTIEVDYSSLHPNILYSLAGVNNPHKDVYGAIVEDLLGKQCNKLRDVIKVCLLVVINAKSYKSFVSSMNKNYNKEYRLLKKYGLTYKQVVDAIKRVHSPIAKYIHSNMSHALMFIESNIMEDILMEMAYRGILGLPLHDSIITQRGNEDLIKEILRRTYKKHTGFEITTTFK